MDKFLKNVLQNFKFDRLNINHRIFYKEYITIDILNDEIIIHDIHSLDPFKIKIKDIEYLKIEK